MKSKVEATPVILLIVFLLVSPPACASGSAVTTNSERSTPTAVVPTATAVTVAQSMPTAAPSTVVVGNTGGIGVFLRRTPAGEKITAWPDGTTMVVVGEDDQVEGTSWKNVRDPDGNTGWAAAEYLVAP